VYRNDRPEVLLDLFFPQREVGDEWNIELFSINVDYLSACRHPGIISDFRSTFRGIEFRVPVTASRPSDNLYGPSGWLPASLRLRQRPACRVDSYPRLPEQFHL